jgi:hypothetical protein
MYRDREWLLPALFIALMTMAMAFTISVATGYPARPSGIASLQLAVAIVVIAALLRFLRHLYQMWRANIPHPYARLRSDFWTAIMAFAPVIAGLVILSVFLYSITFLKSMIPAVVPFWSDDLFAALDRALPIYPQSMAIALSPILPAIGLYYGIWHLVHLGGIIWVLHWQGGNKARHILSFMLAWTLGMSTAYLFSSAGPLFTGVYNIAVAPPSVRLAAEFLWANYKAHGSLIGGGISAFPSMHVALAAWFAIVLRDRGYPRIGAAYVVSIYFCSLILGWHYTADGAGGIGIALLADRSSGLWMRRAAIQHRTATTAAIGASAA